MTKELTDFQKRVLAVIEKAPNQHANWNEVAWNDRVFAKVWNEKRQSRGGLVRAIQKAAQVLKEEGYICILPPKDQHDAATYCGLSKWKKQETNDTN